MDKSNESYLESLHTITDSALQKSLFDSHLLTPDKRVTQLLLLLHELDEAVAGVDGLSMAELSQLVASAIAGCGFVDPIEAWHAIGAVLHVLETPELKTGKS